MLYSVDRVFPTGLRTFAEAAMKRHHNIPPMAHLRNLWLAPLVGAALLGVLLLAMAPSRAAQADDGPSAVHSGHLLVGLTPLLNQQPDAQVAAFFAEEGWIVVRRWPEFALVRLRPAGNPAGRTLDARLAAGISRLRSRPEVRYAEYDGVIQAAARPFLRPAALGDEPPNDPRYPSQWGLQRIAAPVAWDVVQANRSLVVALIDSGLNTSHEDLDPGSLWVNEMESAGQPGVDDDGNGYVDDIHGWDWVEQDNVMDDAFGHGTHVGGTLTAITDNGVGVASVGRDLTIMPLRVLDERGSGFISSLVDALAYARRKGARLVNLSLVLRFDSLAVRDAVRAYAAEGGLIIAATGNYGGQVYWPAAYTETVAVAATNQDDERAVFSNAGPETDVAAPGANILSTYLDNGYYLNDGTSMATPHVTALAALIWSLRPDLNGAQVMDIIRSTAVDVNADIHPGVDNFLGYGRVDAGAALLAASAGVSMSLDFLEGAYISVDQPLRIPVQLTVPGAKDGEVTNTRPISGGVVRYELLGPTAAVGPGGSAAAVAQAGRVATDALGRAVIDFTTPSQAGHYQLHIQHGSQERTFTVDLQDGPLALSVWSQASTLTVGEAPTTLVVEARAGSSGSITAPLPMELVTSLGSFEDGEQTQHVVMRGGRYTTTLQPGTVAGVANITVTAANQTQRSFVTIQPGPPHRIQGPTQIYIVGSGKDGTPLRFVITDRYGNPIWAPRQLHFYALNGRFTPDAASAQLGVVETELTLPTWINRPERFWAILPGAFTIFSGEAHLLKYRYWFPFVGQN